MEKVILDMTMSIKDNDIFYDWEAISIEGALVAVYDVVEVIREQLRAIEAYDVAELDLRDICSLALVNVDEFKILSLSIKMDREVRFTEIESNDKIKHGRKLIDDQMAKEYDESMYLSDLFVYLNKLLTAIINETVITESKKDMELRKKMATELLLDVLSAHKLS